MKITILKNCRAGGQSLEAGKTVEVDDEIGAKLVRLGRATEAKKKAAKKED